MPREPLPLDKQRLLVNVRQAATEDLLNRITVYRAEMEPEALAIIDRELHDRGVTPEQIEAHGQRIEQEVIWLADGLPAKCSLCPQPAVARGWGWLRLLRLIPIFPRHVYYCREHAPEDQGRAGEPPAPRGGDSSG
jgi:hypothetical protein